MFIDLVDDLRCPRPHEQTWLVVAADRTEGRDIVEGTLGCPVCHAEYPIRRGVVWFRTPDTGPSMRRPPNTGADVGGNEVAMRLAAFLDLSDPQGLALLAGSWARYAPALRGLVPTHLVVLDPTSGVEAGNGISVLETDGPIPLADATCRGVALDTSTDAPRIAAAVRILRARGRLVAPAPTPLPAGVTELARDASLWVGERQARPEVVELKRSL